LADELSKRDCCLISGSIGANPGKLDPAQDRGFASPVSQVFSPPHREMQLLTSLPIQAINVDAMEVDFMASLLQLDAAAPLITAIARMFGKTVKFRRCPATVSAPASLPVVL
jgi:hypothetical protein